MQFFVKYQTAKILNVLIFIVVDNNPLFLYYNKSNHNCPFRGAVFNYLKLKLCLKLANISWGQLKK